MNLLWYDNPAVTWHAALPIGNGVLGGMVFGGPAADRIALNHENLWRGKTRTRTTQPVYEHLPRIRELFFQDRLVEAGEETVRYLSGKEPLVQPYQPAGDLTLYFAGHEIVSDYRRQLSLSDGVVEVGYTRHGTRFLRKYLASVEHGALAVRIEADAPASVSVRVHLDRIDDEECPCVPWHRGTRIGLSGRFIEGVCFGVEAQVVATGGKVRSGHGATLDVEQADAVTIYVRAGVGLEGEGEQRGRRDWGLWHDDLPEFEVVEHTHRAEHRALFDRVSLNLGQGEQEKPTGVRLAGLRAGNADPDLLATYFQYGRYLLMNSSRRCQQPANLQGVWNDLLRPPWNSDFHHDINIQMNYWPAEVTNLPECVAPLAQYLRRAIPEGRKAARDLYDCGGIWLPIQTDLWDRAVPDAPYWDVWTGAAAWLAQHLWWHYEYALDETFLREHAYPFMKEAAAFYEDYLVEDAKGRLVTVPSQSPENYFVGGTRPVSLCVGGTMDFALIRDCLGHLIEASHLLGVDADLRPVWQGILDRLPPFQVGRHGQLQEWLEDYEEAEVGHRHLSHLFGLFPGDQIVPDETPALAHAAQVALERREADWKTLTPCGWSLAWASACWARLGNGDKAYECYLRLVRDYSTPALLDLIWPSRAALAHLEEQMAGTSHAEVFQIEANMGGTAAVVEMLLQSHRHVLRFLPALPSAWPSGEARGLRARGGFEVDLAWDHGRLTRAIIRSLKGRECAIRLADARVTQDGRDVDVRRESGRLVFQTKAGEAYRVTPAE